MPRSVGTDGVDQEIRSGSLAALELGVDLLILQGIGKRQRLIEIDVRQHAAERDRLDAGWLGFWSALRAQSGNLTSDAHIAAIALERGAAVYSCDRDFARFPGLKHVDPLAA